MKNEAIYKILGLPERYERNRIVKPDGTLFGFKWALKIVRYFLAETAAESVVYPATLWLDGKPYNGEIEIYRNGFDVVRRVY